MSPKEARILGLATANPIHVIEQEKVAEAAREIFSDRSRHFDRMSGIYANAGIERRQACMPIDWYARDHGWAERNALYIEHALNLLEEAARRCVDRAGLALSAIDALVVVSSTGIATPGLDAHLINRMGLRPNVRRMPLFGLGCGGGVLGLAHAATVARDQPGTNVLFLVVELCTLTFRARDMDKSNIVATALFGDGAAAVLLRASDDRSLPALGASSQHTWPDSLDVMGWAIEDDGLGVIFSRDIPTLVQADLKPFAVEFLARQGMTLSDLAGVVCHPGGAKVVTALASALERPDSDLAVAREVLRDHGNMSAATVLFVLDRMLAEKRRGPHLMTALGPGFTGALMMLDFPG